MHITSIVTMEEVFSMLDRQMNNGVARGGDLDHHRRRGRRGGAEQAVETDKRLRLGGHARLMVF